MIKCTQLAYQHSLTVADKEHKNEVQVSSGSPALTSTSFIFKGSSPLHLPHKIVKILYARCCTLATATADILLQACCTVLGPLLKRTLRWCLMTLLCGSSRLFPKTYGESRDAGRDKGGDRDVAIDGKYNRSYAINGYGLLMRVGEEDKRKPETNRHCLNVVTHHQAGPHAHALHAHHDLCKGSYTSEDLSADSKRIRRQMQVTPYHWGAFCP